MKAKLITLFALVALIAAGLYLDFPDVAICFLALPALLVLLALFQGTRIG